ncbi:hypothetical protein Atoyac23_24 [Aeromonas phage Atoyac23]|nr:hypothetical protein Atoyac23_24 [Aeromonas phage Atoyac23]
MSYDVVNCGELKEFYCPYQELVGRIPITHKESSNEA